MLLAFSVLLVFAFAFTVRNKGLGKWAWIALVVFAVVFSLFCAYSSVRSVWVPHPLSDDVHREQDALGNSQGSLPWSKLSYPLFLSVYHTPFSQLRYQGELAYGEVRFTTFLASANIIQVNGTFSYFYPIMGPSPLYYKIDFMFSDSQEFFNFLIALYTLFDTIGALLGVLVARALYEKAYLSR